jgi:hypothetical protein
MFGTSDWRQLILSAVEALADRIHQERTWFDRPDPVSPGGYREISSPGEEINRLFSDLDFEDYLKSPKITLTPTQQKLGLSLVAKVNHFCDTTPTFLNPAEVIDDPRWSGVREAAGAFAIALRDGK